MKDEEEGDGSSSHANQPRRLRWLWLVGYPKRKFDECRAEKKEESSQDRAARRTANATVWIAIFTFVTVCVAVSTYFVLNGQLKVMQRQLDAMERDQEPYVSIVDKIDPPTYVPIDNQIRWDWHFTNSGKGTAHDLKIEHFISIDSGPFRHSAQISGPVDVGEQASGKSNFMSTFSARDIDQGKSQILAAKDFGIRIFIKFDYADSLGKSYRTEVCIGRLANGVVAEVNHDECKKRTQN